MIAKLVSTDIVILASAHNPSIIAPEWLKTNTLVAEEPKDFMHTPSFSAFESESFVLLVDHQRLQIHGKKQDAESLTSMARLAGKYIRCLPHIPYKALGLNFVWTVQVVEGVNYNKIGLTINDSDMQLVLKEHQIDYGGIIYAKKAPYQLKLVIEPQPEHVFVYNFNYHHELSGLSTDGIVSLIDDFIIRYEHSSQVVRSLYPKEG